MSQYRINLDCLPTPEWEPGKGFSGLYAEAQHDIEMFGGDLDYWGRGIVELSGDQAAYLDATYQDGTGLSIVAGPATGTEHETDVRMPNGHYRTSMQF